MVREEGRTGGRSAVNPFLPPGANDRVRHSTGSASGIQALRERYCSRFSNAAPAGPSPWR